MEHQRLLLNHPMHQKLRDDKLYKHEEYWALRFEHTN